MAEREPVVGNRLMLAGAVMYLLEWVAIISAGETGPSELGKVSTSTIVGLYRDNAKGAGFIAGWCAVVLAGRILMILGARQALRGTRHQTFVDWAVGVMAVSVAVELVEVAVIAGTSHAASAVTLDDGVIVLLDSVSALLFYAVIAAFGLAVAATGAVMHSSRRFPAWIGLLGLAGGTLMMASGVVLGASGGEDGALHSTGMALQAGVPLAWIWMLAGGVYLWRRAGAQPGVVPA